MAEQDFLAWGTDPGANVESQGSYADPGTNPDLATGYPAGAIPPSARFNKTLRQASFGVAAIAQWMSDKTGADVLDNGVIADFIATFEAAIGEQDQADIQAQAGNYGTTAGLVNAYTIALTPVVVAFKPGLVIRAKINITNTGDSTLDYGSGPRQIRYRGAVLQGGELVNGNGYLAVFVDDGTYLNLINPAVTYVGATRLTGTSGTGNTAALTAGPTFTGTIGGANASLTGSMAAASSSTTGAATVGTTLGVGGKVTVASGGIDVGNGSNTGVRVGISGNNEIVAGGSVIALNLGGAGIASFGVASNEIFPLTDNLLSVGDISHRFTTVFATTGTINTSDRNEKQQIKAALENDKLVRAAKRVRARGLVTYKWNHAVEAKGEQARTHLGVIAQDVVEDFKSEGLDAFAFGLVGRDELFEIVTTEEPGEPIMRPKMQTVLVDDFELVQDKKGNAFLKPVKVPREVSVTTKATVLDAAGKPTGEVRELPVMEATPGHPIIKQERKPTGKFRYSVRPDQISYLFLLADMAGK